MVNEKIRIILFYGSIPAALLKFFLFNGFLILTFYQLAIGIFPRIPFFLLSISLIIHIFIKYELEKINPVAKVLENTADVYNSFTKEALESFLFKKNAKDFIKFVLKFPQAKFIIQKAVIGVKDITNASVNPNELADKAFKIAKKLNGQYVTTGDLLTAYLILTEKDTKALFDKKLKEEDILNINNWARVICDEEDKKERKARFVGIGFGETLVWGWTPETQKYTKDLTFSSIRKKALIEGREKEYKLLLDAVQKPQNNNVLLVGELGTGKSNLVENFIYESYEATLPKKLNHRRFLEIMVGPFVAGTVNREDLETRLQSIIEEVNHSGNVILYIPEFQNLMGSSSYNIDLSGAILPYLKDGKIPIIATMTRGEYKKYFENNALREVFEIINLEEPNYEIAMKMLFQKTQEIEDQNKVKLSYHAVIAGVKFADKYEPDSVLPGTAVDLLNDTANIVKIAKGSKSIVLEEDVLETVEQKSKIPLGAPDTKEKMFLLNLESEMHKFIIGQDEAIKAISEAIRRIRAGLAREKPISFLFLGPTGVGKTETAKTLAKLYFGGEVHIIRLDMSEYATEQGLSRILATGENSFLDEVSSHPFSLILLDEFEKANEKILNLFLQVFDDGRMTDNNGKTVSFNNTIIIATSNGGSEFIRESLVNNTLITNQILLEYLQRNGLFAPELLNRFDEIVVFRPLTQEEILQITNLLLSDFSKRILKQDISLSFDPGAIDLIARGGFNEEFGARPLARFIQDKVEDVIAKKILQGEIARGDKVLVSVDPSSNLTFSKHLSLN